MAKFTIGCTLFLIVAGYGMQAEHHEHDATSRPSSGQSALSPPQAMQIEHRHLHQQLDAALTAGGKTGVAAKQVQATLAPHFVAEESYAMPPLSLLPTLANRQQPTDKQMHAAISMADKLRTNHKQMLEEHKQIVSALRHLADAAKEENKPQAARFAEELMRHARNEEEVLYPAVLVLGDYLKLKLSHGH